MIIGLGADHAGYYLKNIVRSYLQQQGITVRDFGTHTDSPCDYPDFALMVANAVAQGECDLGILICGTGVGMSISANKVRGIRAAHAQDPVTARLARQHNDANVLCMGGRIIGAELAMEIVSAFLNASFTDEERHVRRVNKVNMLEKRYAEGERERESTG
ncbi:MAG: ribose 5-phosphate isomerase B [Armatimonadota bacterium]|nr:ribose 5-phosphate isomerase B [bacterium]MDW8104833.1 ribose 5-phosphate isomerase B [Armatimonadota bacterium]MDW8290755.1 ribose 5-phosphate isomerase B [Armatimonadota bacterium]